MKIKKKIIFFSIFLTLCFSFLVGCEKESNTNKNVDSSLSEIKEDNKDSEQKTQPEIDETQTSSNEDVIDLDKKIDDKIKEEQTKLEEENKTDDLKSSLENFPQPKTFDKTFDSTIYESELNSDLTLETAYKMVFNLPSVSKTISSNKKYELYVTEGTTTYDLYIVKKEGNIEKNGKLIPLIEHLYQIDKISKKMYHFDMKQNEFVEIKNNS